MTTTNSKTTTKTRARKVPTQAHETMPARILTLEQAAKIDAPSITDAGTVAPIKGDGARTEKKKRAHATTAHVFALRMAYKLGGGVENEVGAAGAMTDAVREWETEAPGIARKALKLALVKLCGDAGVCRALRYVLDNLPAEVVAARGGARRSGLRKINVDKKGRRLLFGLAMPAGFAAFTHVRVIERDGCLVLEPVAAEGGAQ